MWLETKKAIVVLVGALLNALALNLFLIPANVYSSGFTGVAQLVSSIVTDYTPFTISTGVLLLLLNIPVTILGWKKVGKSFTVYSFISVAATTLFL
ncbi:YitT family protein, partial [Priestia megaterium]